MLLQGNQGQTGKQLGQNLTAGLGEYSDLLATELMPRYYENVYRGNVFLAANQAVATTAAGLTSGSSTPLVLYNPAGSGKNLVLLEILTNAVFPSAAAANYQIWLAACVTPTQAAPGGTTVLPVRAALLGSGAAAVGQASSQANLPSTPVVVRNLGVLQGFSTATGNSLVMGFFKDETAGSVIVSPGIIVAVQSSAAMSLGCSMSWLELPI